jgi:hypothetical protein
MRTSRTRAEREYAVSTTYREIDRGTFPALRIGESATMSDTPMPETLESLAAKITQLSEKVQAGFNQADARFWSIDRKLDETRAQLGVKIEAVDTRVTQVYDAVIALTSHEKQNRRDHGRFAKKLEEHDLRLLALEHPVRRNRRKAER